MKFIEKLNSKHQGKGIANLMLYIISLQAIVYFTLYIRPNPSGVYKLYLLPSEVLSGEIWRVITFLAIPPSSSIIFIIFVLLFYYFIGNTLENYWGTFKFNLFYFLSVFLTIITSLITGYPGSNTYINFSLLFAFATLNPDYEIRLYFFIPLKIKWLAYFQAAVYIFLLITGNVPQKLFILSSIASYLLFFNSELYDIIKTKIYLYKHKRRK